MREKRARSIVQINFGSMFPAGFVAPPLGAQLKGFHLFEGQTLNGERKITFQIHSSGCRTLAQGHSRNRRCDKRNWFAAELKGEALDCTRKIARWKISRRMNWFRSEIMFADNCF